MSIEHTSLADRGTEALDGVFLAQLATGEHMSVQHFCIESGAVVEAHATHAVENRGDETAVGIELLSPRPDPPWAE